MNTSTISTFRRAAVLEAEAERIENILAELGETGSARLSGGDLYTRDEENASEMFRGKFDADNAAAVLADFNSR